MSPEQEAELARLIEQQANAAIRGKITTQLPNISPRNEQDEIANLINQIDVEITKNRNTMKTYR